VKRIPGRTLTPEPFFTYFGSKHNLAGRYPVPKHDVVVEPFAGSAAYATVHFQKRVILYDVSPVVCGVWEFLIMSSVTDVLRLPTQVIDVSDLKVCQEAKWLIGFWLKKGNVVPVNVPSPRMRSRMRPDSHWGWMIRSRIAKNVGKIKHWKVINKSFVDCPDRVATWFIDPPYQRSGVAYPHHDVNYSMLSEWTKRRKGQTIACGQEGDNWLPFQKFANISNVVNGRSQEMVWYKER
jgi:hypothetical protein